MTKIKSIRTFSWMSPNLEVRIDSKYGKNGKGVFAKKKIEKEESLFIFGGYVMSLKDVQKLPKSFRDEGLTISDDFALTIKKSDEVEAGSFVNHSCNPNAGYRGQIFLVAMRDIKMNEEITFDYAMVLSDKEKYSMKCSCESRNCRGIVTSSDWKNRILQKKYEGYFQYYLQEKIQNI